MNQSPNVPEGRKEACKTYLEQTKLLVTLASAFLFAPASLVAILKDRLTAHLSVSDIRWFVAAEVCFVASVLLGYIVLGSLTGSQDSGAFDVFRAATRYTSLAQFFFYLVGLCTFIGFAVHLVSR
jgi:hypothetical protein